MKKLFTLNLLLLICVSGLIAQTRYVDEIFDEVEETTDIVYGVNATLLFLPVFGEAVPEQLVMDMYSPAGDDATDRPVVLLFHTGNFLPSITNAQIAGSRKDSSAVEMCRQLARRGFVACSVDYRLGWNPLAETQPARALGLIQAAYRGLQDGRNAIRYIKANAVDYGIDPEKITMWGNGTGGYLVLATATLDDYLEIVTTENGPGKFLLDADGDGVPETPMVIPSFHGDIEGKVLTVTPEDGSSVPFGLPPGDTTNYVNYPDESSDYAMTVNVGGALGDVSWIDENTGPIISVQSAFDQFAPYDDAVLIVPTTGDPIVQVQGGLAISRKQAELGNNDAFANGIFDDPITQLAKDNAAAAGHEYIEGLFPWVKDPNSNGFDEGVVINWWDPNGLVTFLSDMGPVTAPLNMIPHPLGGTFHSNGLILNEGMSAEKSRANIADIMAYVIPRMCLGLALPECDFLFTGTEDVLEDDSFLTISPNPVSDRMTIESATELIQSVEVYNTNGQLVFKNSNVNARTFTVDRVSIGTGMFVVKTAFENGISARKVMVK
jgi:hypothetical protein